MARKAKKHRRRQNSQGSSLLATPVWIMHSRWDWPGQWRWLAHPPGVASAQEGFVEAAVHGEDLAGGLAQAVADQQEIGFGLVGGGDGGLGQGAVGVELGQFLDERFGGFALDRKSTRL